jgi:RNA polymerase sigma-70 factor, ECF subfamily
VRPGAREAGRLRGGAVDIDLDQIVVQFRPVVGFKVRRALGGRNPDWEDVVNEILMQAIEKIKTGDFRGDSSVGTFIYTITSRRIVDYIRQKTRVLREAPEVHDLPDPHDQVERDERAELLAQAIRTLKPKYRDVLYLYYYKELNRDEVARLLGIAPARVSERVNYAQKLLRKLLERRILPFSGPPGD